MKIKRVALESKTLPQISKQNSKPSRLQRIGDSPFPGITLRQILCNHTAQIEEIAWSPNGLMLSSLAADQTICIYDNSNWQLLKKLQGAGSEFALSWSPDNLKLATGRWEKIQVWDVTASKIKSELTGHMDAVFSIAWDPTGKYIASGSQDNTVRVWDVATGKESWIQNECGSIQALAWSPDGTLLASGGDYNTISIYEPTSGQVLHKLQWGGEKHGVLNGIDSIAWSKDGTKLVSAGNDSVIRLWDTDSWRVINALEAHTKSVVTVRLSPNGLLLASKSWDGTVIIWNAASGRKLAELSESFYGNPIQGVAFHPTQPLFATVGEKDSVIHIWELEYETLLQSINDKGFKRYTTAKIVLVGDSGVGKTGLGWRLAHGNFKEHSSTHGQQFWMLQQLCKQRRDGALCEAILWDLAGQDDYRLIHALFLDDADLVLVLFDPTRHDDPLSGVEFWLKQLKVGTSDTTGTPTVLIAARTDRGTPRLAQDELEEYCRQRGIQVYLPTSAKANKGIEELIRHMQNLIPWDNKPATVTTETFKRIKDFVLDMKENSRRRKVIFTPEELRQRLVKTDRKWQFTDAEMLTAVGHLASHGYVTRLKTSLGEPRILLAPELLNNLAASFVLEARRNRKGLGSLEEEQLLSGSYEFLELEKLAGTEKEIMLDSAAVLFLEHKVCFRETDPLNGRTYLVFPELINLKKPLLGDDDSVEDGVAYTVSGSVENLYASLVVLMGYTQTFTRTNQWRNQSRYEVGQGLVCGFRQEEERAGELDFVLYFCSKTPTSVRTLFQGLFESFLAQRNLTARRFDPAVCSQGHALNRGVVREQIANNADFVFCSRCGEKITLPKTDQAIQLSRHQAEEVEVNRRAADLRTRFERILFRLKTYANEEKIVLPECFISYAWGIPEHERWVEKSLATDLQKAGITVVLDRWENARIGASVPRFVERVGKSDRIIVVGTLLYRQKYDNNKPMRSFVVAAEGDLIGKRMIGTEALKESVLPVLLEGTEELAFPHLLQGRVYADFRKNENYFDVAFELLLSLYGINTTEPVAVELRASLNS